MANWLTSGRWVVDLAWLLFLLFMLRYFWCKRKALAQTKLWLITKGRITQFEWTREGHRLWPRIVYTYQVFDQDFQNEDLFIDTSHNSPHSKYARMVAYRAALAYEKDQELDVYYNPNDPQQAALDISTPRKLNLIIVLLVLLIVLHLVIVVARLL